jgi:hypothetical protein
MLNPNRMSSFLEPILKILIVLFVGNFLYNWLTTDYDDEDSVTITFRCKQVMDMQNNYPDFVVKQCKELRQ